MSRIVLRAARSAPFTSVSHLYVRQKNMSRRDITRTHDWFLADTRCQKWIIQCVACQQFGRKPETPQTIPKYRFDEMFPVIHLDDSGICQECRANATTGGITDKNENEK
jgi:hypothetical protein